VAVSALTRYPSRRSHPGSLAKFAAMLLDKTLDLLKTRDDAAPRARSGRPFCILEKHDFT
jgi:hypothetical protein